MPFASDHEQLNRGGPPYPPRNAGLGGTPNPIPDVPISIILLVIYLALGITHIRIFKRNKSRGHKFIFNGALLGKSTPGNISNLITELIILGLCKIRVITMSLRVAWTYNPRNTSLAIAANIFVYVGTVILYGLDWFFAQRIIRAQHTHFGWSTRYRVFHRTGLVLLISCLLVLVITQVWQFFTLDEDKLSTFHDLYLMAQTYFTVFAAAPAAMLTISLLIPRTEVEKFGAGRMRNNITILYIAAFILSIGQIFRCVLAYLPPTPLQPVQRGTQELPVYLSKAFFYCFNFLTEILVIAMFAVVRVDLRFHIPNGSKKTGDYSSSRIHIDKGDSEKLPIHPPMIHNNDSCGTIYRYGSSIFEDTSTLADSLRYPSSIIEMDEKTGVWKVKRLSRESSVRTSNTFASTSRMSMQLHNEKHDSDAPPIPPAPTAWPLPDAIPPHRSEPVLEHSNPVSRRSTIKRGTYEFDGHHLNSTNVGDAVTAALNNLEMNSERNRWKTLPPPPRSRSTRSVHNNSTQQPKSVLKNRSRTASASATGRRSQSHSRIDSTQTASHNGTSNTSKAPPPVPKSPAFSPRPHAFSTDTMRTPSPSYIERLEIISTFERMSSPRLQDSHSDSNARKRSSSVPASQSPDLLNSPTSSDVSGSSTTSSGTRDAERMTLEFRRFSSESPPRPYELHDLLSTSRYDLPASNPGGSGNGNGNSGPNLSGGRDELWMGR